MCDSVESTKASSQESALSRGLESIVALLHVLLNRGRQRYGVLYTATSTHACNLTSLLRT